jgi:hypothetical protein
MKLAYFLGNEEWLLDGWPHYEDQALSKMLASHRLRILAPSLELNRRGFQTRLISAQNTTAELTEWLDSDTSLVIGKLSHPDPAAFEQLSSHAIALIELAKQKRVRIIVDYTDDIIGIGDHRAQRTLELLRLADCVTCSSDELSHRARLYVGRQHSVLSIPDCVEGEASDPQPCSISATQKPLGLVWFGHPTNLSSLLSLLPDLHELNQTIPLRLDIVTNLNDEDLLGIQLFILSQSFLFEIEFLRWQGPRELASSMRQSSVAIIPVDLEGSKAFASHNRIAQAIWNGCFAVASPAASYQTFAEHAWLGERLTDGIRWACNNADAAYQKIQAGQRLIRSRYSISSVSDQWQAAITGTTTQKQAITPESIRLNLGSGNHPLPGYVNVDIAAARAGISPELMGDIRQLPQLASDLADEIMAIHVVEHFYRWEVSNILLEWKRILRPGGRLVLECPNLLSACEALLADGGEIAEADARARSSMWVFYGDPAWQDPLMCHRWGYTPRSLINLLESCGFETCRQTQAQFKAREPRDMRIEAVKPLT